MIEQVNSYIINKYNIPANAKLLVAVSGGIDSMVLLHYLSSHGFEISVAHINHSTRNGESDEDQLFVEAYCAENNIPCFTKKLRYEKLKRGNFQENARNARYDFFQDCLNEYNIDILATAHHADDQWETFILNLTRGSGLQGLKGIYEMRDNVIRPFLTITQDEILEYQQENNVPYVEDSSNKEEVYMRNKVRHTVTPAMNKVFPGFINKVTTSTHYLREELKLLQELVEIVREQVFEESKKKIKIKLKGIKEYQNSDMLLYYLLHPYGFDWTTAEDIVKSERTGALFQSKDYEILYDRKKLILRKRNSEKLHISIDIEDYGNFSTDVCDISVHLNDRESTVDKHLLLDVNKLIFPLKIRSWQAGDKFQPAGMNGSKKKVKNFLTDLKLNRFEKENILVLLQKDKIIQVIGYRTAEGYIAEGDIGVKITFSIDN